MNTKGIIKTIKIKPLFSLLLMGIGQLYGAFVIYRLGVLKIKEDWINLVCGIAVIILLCWSFYVLYSFSRYFSLKETKIVLKEHTFSLFGVILNYSDVKNVTIDSTKSELSISIDMKYLEEPIPIVSKYMKLQDFHFLVKTLIEKIP